MSMSIAGASLLGLAIGVRHAFEPDHLAAVATMVPERRSVARGALVGALWGLGHTTVLLVVVAALAALGAQFSPAAERAFELVVSLMLVLLGARAIWRAWRQGRSGDDVEHAHGTRTHQHPAAARHVHVLGTALAIQPLVIGAVHGLAGSGGLAAAAAATQASTGAQVGYAALFGLGSMIGMALVSALGTLALARSRARWLAVAQVGLGGVSIVVGVAWALAAQGVA